MEQSGARQHTFPIDVPRTWHGTIHITGIYASLRNNTISRIALQHTLTAAKSLDAETDLVDLLDDLHTTEVVGFLLDSCKLKLPVFDLANEDAGDATDLTRHVWTADAVMLASPMYHGSYSSPLKTALDYCGFDEFENKTVVLLAVSGGSFPITA